MKRSRKTSKISKVSKTCKTKKYRLVIMATIILSSLTLFACKPVDPAPTSTNSALSGQGDPSSGGQESKGTDSSSQMDSSQHTSSISGSISEDDGDRSDISEGEGHVISIYSDESLSLSSILSSLVPGISDFISRVSGQSSSPLSSLSSLSPSSGHSSSPSSQGGNQSSSSTSSETGPPPDWQLYWSEEFNKKLPGYDNNGLDPAVWNYDEQLNKENVKWTKRRENVRVEDGNLVLTLIKENYINYKYTGAAINTDKKVSFKYGRIEIRAKLTYGHAVHPAFWTLGDDYHYGTGDNRGWPNAGEIDIMEFVGRGSESEKNITAENRRTTCNLHWGIGEAKHKYDYGEYYMPEGKILADDYHIYAIEWDENSIKWFFDKIQIHEVDINDPTMNNAFHRPHWLIISIGLDKNLNDTTPLPQTMYVDYIRYYKDKNKS